MINRRNFLGTLALLPTAPSLLAGYKGDSCLDSGSFCPMDLRLIKDDWGNIKLRATKGSYWTEMSGASDCIDYHGLCATAEATYLMIQELELSNESRRLIFQQYFEFEDQERKKWIDSLKRIKVTKQEKMDIYNVLKKLRGPHNCCWDTSVTEKWGINQLCVWG